MAATVSRKIVAKLPQYDLLFTSVIMQELLWKQALKRISVHVEAVKWFFKMGYTSVYGLQYCSCKSAPLLFSKMICPHQLKKIAVLGCYPPDPANHPEFYKNRNVGILATGTVAVGFIFYWK